MSEYNGNEIMEDLCSVQKPKINNVGDIINILKYYDPKLKVDIAISANNDNSYFEYYDFYKFGIFYSSDGFFDVDYLIIECKPKKENSNKDENKE